MLTVSFWRCGQAAWASREWLKVQQAEPVTAKILPNDFSDDLVTSQSLSYTHSSTPGESNGRGKQLRDIRSTKDISMFPTRDQKYNNTSKQCAAGGPVHATSLLAAWIVSPNAKIEIQKF